MRCNDVGPRFCRPRRPPLHPRRAQGPGRRLHQRLALGEPEVSGARVGLGLLVLFSVPGLALSASASPMFMGLGDLPGGSFSSAALGVSADGSVVVGQSNSGIDVEAFRWTRDEGMVGLGDLLGGNFVSFAFGASEDGSVIVGWSSSSLGDEAFRWTSDGGMVGLGDLPTGGFSSRGFGVSADGSVVVGFGFSVGSEAFRWTSMDGLVGLGELPGGGTGSSAFGVSADGLAVVGQTRGPHGSCMTWSGRSPCPISRLALAVGSGSRRSAESTFRGPRKAFGLCSHIAANPLCMAGLTWTPPDADAALKSPEFRLDLPVLDKPGMPRATDFEPEGRGFESLPACH